jgi:hypothetical protein
MIYGYARVSTTDQDLSIQKATLTAAGCTIIREEKVSGTSTKGREELKTLLEFLREGDTLGPAPTDFITILQRSPGCDPAHILVRQSRPW